MDGCEWKQPRNVGWFLKVQCWWWRDKKPQNESGPTSHLTRFPQQISIPISSAFPYLFNNKFLFSSFLFFLSYLGRLETKKKNEVRNSPSNFYHTIIKLLIKQGNHLWLKYFTFITFFNFFFFFLFYLFIFYILFYFFIFFKYLSC